MSAETDTPRTDAAIQCDCVGDYIHVDFCRDLERENTSLRQHWADDDTRIKEITKSVLPDFDTDGGGYFVDMVECAEAMAERIRELEGRWLPIESAPKGQSLILLLPAFDGWPSGAWRGAWSFLEMSWVLHVPLTKDGKRVTINGLPQPIAWQPLPQPPKERTTL